VNLVEDFLANADLSDLPPELSAFRPTGTLLLSSRRDTSRYATALLLDSSGTPRIVAKIVRRPHRQERLAAEFEMLQLLAGRGTIHPVAPLPLALVQHRDHWLLLETAIDGMLLDGKRFARPPRRLWQRVDQWLVDLSSPTATADAAWHDEQISEPLRWIEDALAATAEERSFFAATESLTHQLTSVALPVPIEHGDFFKSHIAVSRSRRLAAIDWELGRPKGLIGADAATFLIGVFSSGGLAGEATAVAYARHFLDAGGLARQWLQDHLARQGVERSWVDHILLATLARRVLNIWGPVVADTANAPAPQFEHARALFRNFWSLRLWRMTMEHMAH
jgi:hypothetical protein